MHQVIARVNLVLSVAIAAAFSSGPIRADQVLIDFGPGFNVTNVEARDAKASLAGQPAAALRIATGRSQQWPGVTLKAPQGRWDLSAFDHLAMDAKNAGETPVDVRCRVDSGTGPKQHSLDDGVRLEPGETKTLRVTLVRRLPERLIEKLFGMRGNPGGVEADKGIDPGDVTQIILFVPKPSAEHVFEVRAIRAAGTNDNYKWLDLDQKKLFPLIDRYGQFIHKDWPGKTHSDEDLKRRRAEEAADLAAKPGPGDWNQYGGWQSGPKLQASGFFRVQKHEGKWWLVDPEGRLFWSHGSDCIRSGVDATPITDREHYYADLPGRDSPFAVFYGRGRWAPHGYYQGKSYETYSHSGANLMRKYGDGFARQFNEAAHRRLRSWGMNTIGNWSSREVSLLRKTPYVATVGSGRKPLEGSSGYWGKFPDVFDPEFQSATRKAMAAEKGATAGDPWCLGYFVDNEIAWGEELSLAEATLKSPPTQAAKKVFLADLKTKYGTIEKLNAAWGTKHASWDALSESRDAPDRKRAYDDLAAFSTKTAEQYFRVCRDAVSEAARASSISAAALPGSTTARSAPPPTTAT